MGVFFPYDAVMHEVVCEDACMGAVKGRAMRMGRFAGPTVPIQARVPQEIRDMLRIMADHDHLSMSGVQEKIIRAEYNRRQQARALQEEITM